MLVAESPGAMVVEATIFSVAERPGAKVVETPTALAANAAAIELKDDPSEEENKVIPLRAPSVQVTFRVITTSVRGVGIDTEVPPFRLDDNIKLDSVDSNVFVIVFTFVSANNNNKYREVKSIFIVSVKATTAFKTILSEKLENIKSLVKCDLGIILKKLNLNIYVV